MKKKILQVCAVDFTMKTFLTPLLEGLEHSGYEVHMACHDGPFVDELRKRFAFHPVSFERNLNPISLLRAFFQLYQVIRRGKFDIVHVHSPIAAFIGRFAAYFARTPCVYTAHGFYFHDNMPKGQRFLWVFLERMAGRVTDYLFTQSEEDHQTALKERISSPAKTLTIGNGVPLKRFVFDQEKRDQARIKVRAEFGIPDNTKIVSMVGRVVREKGYFEMLEAAAIVLKKLPNTHFLLIGPALESERDSAMPLLKHRVTELGIETAVSFTGNRNDIPVLLNASEVFCLPSYREGRPRSIIEAMACHLPIVATNIRGCREDVKDGFNGFLVPVRDCQILAESVLRLLQDENVRKDLADNAFRYATENLDETKVIERQIKVFEQMLHQRYCS